MNYGYAKSKLDGTEKRFEGIQDLDLPEEYSYIPYLPKVLNQGNNPICVPCSLSAHLNWNINIEDGMNTRDNKIDLFQIYRKRSNVGDGMSFKEALHFLKHEGVKSNAGLIKIKKYAMIGSIEPLKQAILLNGPCVGGLLVYDSISCKFWEKGYNCEGGHAISIVGWNKEGFIIRNSWGTSFCNKGYTVIPYEDFDNFMEIWTIID